MTFKELTGKARELPEGLRIWGCVMGGYTWSILFEPGQPEWSAEERAAWTGYSAVYRQDHIMRQPLLDGTLGEDMIKVEEGRCFPSFAECEAACRRTLKSIRAAH